MSAGPIEQAISNGLDFLARNQLPYGELKTCASSDPKMEAECRFDSSPFATSLVLYALSFVDDPRVAVMTARALDFLAAEMEGSGLWRYWSSRNLRHRQLPPDLDDICCISHCLKKQGRPLPANREIILANRNEAGAFYTWLVPRTTAPPEMSQAINRLVGAETLLAILLAGTINDVDCAVNANVLLYLGQGEETRGAVEYLIGVVLDDREKECNHFYPGPLAFYYMLSRACFNGVSALAAIRTPVLDKLLPLQESDGSFGDALPTALAACTLLNFDHRAPALHRAVEHLLVAQGQDGSWPRLPFFLGPAPYYGSEELTTALCVEALSRTRCDERAHPIHQPARG
jgi:hypothetical protein